MRRLALFFCAVSAACGSLPRAVSERGFAEVKIGVTTRAELSQRFGVPTWVEFLDWGQERQTWHHPRPMTRHEFAALEYPKDRVYEAIYDLRNGVVVAKSWAQLQRRDDGSFNAIARKGEP